MRLVTEMRVEGRITLISVHDDTALKHFSRHVPKVVIYDYLRDLCNKDLEASKNYLDKLHVDYDWIVEFGQPVEQILLAGKRGGYDLIVLGTKGRSIFNDLLLGSVATRVASASSIPVTLVK